MQNLTVLNLGNNWFHGTLPSFLADLPLLRVLNLGSQFGGNEGSDLLGLVGSIPAGVQQLGYLRELVLEANSLSGQLPKGLCHNGETAMECMQWCGRFLLYLMTLSILAALSHRLFQQR